MRLEPLVTITSRFQRAICIDTDLGSPDALEGFICPQSSTDALLNMVRHISQTGQCAFTWTGPYGSGKSSLLVALGSLLSGNGKARNDASKAIGEHKSKEILDNLPPHKHGWQVLPVVGRRASPSSVFGDVLWKSKLHPKKIATTLDDSEIIETLLKIAKDKPRSTGGLIVFIDEMGKFLEGAANTNSDIYFFQQLAEAASRSNNRLIIIGVLHQAFSEYAHRLSREMRDEWSKIQGRFIDLPINVAGEEQLDLLSKAICSDNKPKTPTIISKQLSLIIGHNKRGISTNFEVILDLCWPLHPLVACLLGPISRRRFGQNQRSLFGFLNSAEPSAFKSFLTGARKGELYNTDHLWSYLRFNLEPTILSSPDGHRWSLAVETIERCEAQLDQGIHLRLLKAIALIDLFKGTSGLIPSKQLILACFDDIPEPEITKSLKELTKGSFIIFKKHIEAYAIYAGSDFDIEDAVNSARESIRDIDFSSLKRLAGLQPILAKRHYHTTGALRWFDVDIVPIKQLIETVKATTPTSDSIGQFLLAVSTENETEEIGKNICSEATTYSAKQGIIVGLSKQSWTINDLALEILALKKVYEVSTELAGDSVARREIRANRSELQGRLEAELNKAFDHAIWYLHDQTTKELSRRDLSVFASKIADKQFYDSPRIQNELLNRIKPSSSAIAAQNGLLRYMVTHEGQSQLGIDGFPAEGGLFSAILDKSGLYNSQIGKFEAPGLNGTDLCNLKPAWEAATKYLQKKSDRSVSVDELYIVWQQPPYGIKKGLMPILAVAYILTQRSALAFYRDGIFQSQLSDIDVEVIAKVPASIQLRYMNLSEVSKTILSGMANIVRDLDDSNILQHLEPIDVARGLIAIYDKIHPWAQRTMHLSKEAIRIRNLFKKANDPNRFLFDDIPSLLGQKVNLKDKNTIVEIVQFIYEGLKELKNAYPTEINRLREIMLSELQVPNLSPQTITALRERAENIKDISGDFQFEAFVVRLSKFDGSDKAIEGIASLAVSKPPRNWLDNDIDRSKLEITALAQKFIRTESFARVKKGRGDKRHSLAVVVGINGRPTPLYQDFNVADTDRVQIDQISKQFSDIIKNANQSNRSIILAALVELCAEYIQDSTKNASIEDKAAS